jgi:uncharacterized protein YecE (DUF72 family)
MIYIGVGGWTYEPWRGGFYPSGLPQKRELAFMSSKMTSVEINGTYYRTPKPADFQKWAAETPDNFVFSLKAPRFATNRRILAEAAPSIDRFFASGLAALGQKLGPINWQFAPTKAFDPADMAAFLKLLPREIDGSRVRHALEVRHPSFACPEFIALADHHGAAIIHAGDSHYPEIEAATADFSYLRIMGTTEKHKAGYSTADLERWARTAKTLATGGRDVFLYVISGFKETNPLAAMALADHTR